ncbi:hypothetical protein L6R52_32320 [Myxococcota bacterium]|nr:hypothetical protein [Myxococcota bacterium]
MLAAIARVSLLAIALVGASARDAAAVRFALGVATDLTPIVVDPARPPDAAAPVLFGFRPVLEVEANEYFSVGAYAPFTVYRSASTGAASSGAESVFGLTLSGRYPVLRDRGPEELMFYGTLRGGFGTVDGRAGPFVGGALGAAATWLDTGRGLFAELSVSRLDVAGLEGTADVERTSIGLSVGLVFRLGGEGWRLGAKPVEERDP